MIYDQIINPFDSKIKVKLNSITDSKLLIVKCNNISERKAVSNLVLSKGYSTLAIGIDKWRENFVSYSNTRFNEMEWYTNDRMNYDYHYYAYEDPDYEGVIIYNHDSNLRLNKFIMSDDVIDLDYNAVVIYPNHMILKSKIIDEFNERKMKVYKPNLTGNFTVLERRGCESRIINNIQNADLCLCYMNLIFEGYDIRKILLLKDICNNNLDVKDLFKLLCNEYYDCVNF